MNEKKVCFVSFLASTIKTKHIILLPVQTSYQRPFKPVIRAIIGCDLSGIIHVDHVIG
jgi:hypothetical protein